METHGPHLIPSVCKDFLISLQHHFPFIASLSAVKAAHNEVQTCRGNVGQGMRCRDPGACIPPVPWPAAGQKFQHIPDTTRAFILEGISVIFRSPEKKSVTQMSLWAPSMGSIRRGEQSSEPGAAQTPQSWGLFGGYLGVISPALAQGSVRICTALFLCWGSTRSSASPVLLHTDHLHPFLGLPKNRSQAKFRE